MLDSIETYRREVSSALSSVSGARIMEAVQALLAVHRRRGTIFVLCPPEDSEAASHFVRALADGIGAGPFAFRLVQLYGSPGQVVAWQHDWAYEDIYCEQMRGVIRQGDCVVAISRRGDSLSVVRALEAARRAGAATIALVGPGGEPVAQAADIRLDIRAGQAEQVEDVLVMLEHMLCHTLRRLLARTESAMEASRREGIGG